jgi:hypothetical protein
MHLHLSDEIVRQIECGLHVASLPSCSFSGEQVAGGPFGGHAASPPIAQHPSARAASPSRGRR